MYRNQFVVYDIKTILLFANLDNDSTKVLIFIIDFNLLILEAHT